MKRERVAIIGSGPAGLTAALYTARAQLSTVVFVGKLLGGQISTTHEVENFPGFPNGTTGPELVENMKQQAEKFGAKFVFESVTEVDFSKGSPFLLKTDSGDTYSADSVIVTIGANPRELGIPGEREFVGRGVSYCATCDGFFFRGKDITVVGGGDSALQEAIFLTKFGKSVNVIHRRDDLRASTALQVRAKANPKITFTYSTTVEEVKGEASNGGPAIVKAVVLRDVKTGQTYEKPTDGVFIFIGYDPNSWLFKGQLALDESDYMKIDHLMQTSAEGVFAAGEIHDSVFRQAITAAGDGCKAALSAIKWLAEREESLQPLDTEAVAAGD
ncbi:MAG: thioredoxin-disulfide reductase [Anaerolineae bacterium]|nr:thioredoxin-disulfide reductase [Anaerolineae bacterium]MBN8620014.1 thioredoxin-disulfide reductase [Anaerolineae bacterium]